MAGKHKPGTSKPKGPVQVSVKWIKITEVSIDGTNAKRVLFAGMDNENNWNYFWFVLNGDTVLWGERLVQRMENGNNVTVTSVGTANITFEWSDTYSTGGLATTVETVEPHPVHRQATNVAAV